MVTRESEWDDATRDRAERFAEYERSLCPCGCGVTVDQAWDPFFEPWAVDHYTCYARRALEKVRRDWEETHKGQADGWADGVEHFVVPAEGAAHNAVAAAKAEDRKKRGSGGD